MSRRSLPQLARHVCIRQTLEHLEQIRQLVFVIGEHERVGRHHKRKHALPSGRCESRGTRERTFRNRRAHVRIEVLAERAAADPLQLAV